MSREVKRVYVWGWYGYKNSGDDALLVMMSKAMAEVTHNIELVLQIPKYGQLPPLFCKAILKPIRRWFKGHARLSKALTILRTDALLFGGGSNMSDVDRNRMASLRSRYQICRIARIKHIPMIAAALGLGPLVTKEGAELAAKILNMMDLVVVRDSTSYHLCRQLKVRSTVVQGFDPTVLIPELFPQQLAAKDNKDKNLVTIGVSLSGSSGTIENQGLRQGSRIDNLVNGIRNIAARYPLCIAGVEMCGGNEYGDRKLITKLLDSLDGVCNVKMISYCPDPVEMMRTLSSLNGIIAERLHAAIYAYALGVPFAIVPYHSKCVAFAKDVGLSENFLLDPQMQTIQIINVLESQIRVHNDYKPATSVERARELASFGQRAVVDKLRTLL